MPVHHGLATMAGLGLTGVVPFCRFSRWEHTASKGKGIGEWRSPHRGQNRPARHQGEASGEEEKVTVVAIGDGQLWSIERWRKMQGKVR
jgi:hypothetical protein